MKRVGLLFGLLLLMPHAAHACYPIKLTLSQINQYSPLVVIAKVSAIHDSTVELEVTQILKNPEGVAIRSITLHVIKENCPSIVISQFQFNHLYLVALYSTKKTVWKTTEGLYVTEVVANTIQVRPEGNTENRWVSVDDVALFMNPPSLIPSYVFISAVGLFLIGVIFYLWHKRA